MEIKNRKAYHEYMVLQELDCGIVLKGTEVKSIRDGKCNISDSYCYIDGNEVWLVGSYISKYKTDKFTNHEEDAKRKILMTKREILKLSQQLSTPGITLVPLKIFEKNHLFKVKIGLCKGKKEYDKRETIKEKDTKRELDRIKKQF